MKKKIFIIALFLFVIGLMTACNVGNIGGTGSDDSTQKDIYDSAKTDTSSYEAWLNSIKGSNGREVELSVVNGVVVWHYVGDAAWIPLFSIDGVNGSDGINGINGVDGKDGKEVEIRFFNNVLQWHYSGENEWNDLFNTNALKGEAGNNGVGIRSIDKIKSDELIDTYAISYTDGTMTTFTITNGIKGEKGDKGDKGDQGDKGEQGVGIKSVELLKTEELEDTYVITFSDDTTTTFTITNGVQGEKGAGITEIKLTESPNAFLDIYTIYFEDGSTFDFEVRHGEPLDQRKFNVTFDSNGGTEVESQEVQFGYKAVKPEDPVKEGYKFEGWYAGEERWIFVGYFVTENLDLVAKWSIAEYEISYEYDGAEEVEDAPTSYTMLDDDIDLPEPTKVGYTFLGWCETEELLNPTKKLASGSTGDMTYYAKWQVNEHKISFESNGGTQYEDLDFEYNGNVELPTPERTGYQFLYWSTEENMQHKYVGDFDEDTDLTLYARWMVNGNAPYTVLVYKQNLDGTYSMTPSETITLDAQPETTVQAQNYGYAGFNDPNYLPSGLVVSDGSLKLKVFYPRATYQIQYYDGNNWQYYYFKYEEKVEVPEPSKVGYVFTGWNMEIPEKMPSYNFGISATWQANLYKVTFDVNGGDALAKAEYMYGQQVELPTPTFAGYEFAGWYCEGRKVENGNWSYLKDVTLVANWATLSDDFVFAQVEDHLELVSYKGSDTEITVPTIADGVLVKAIGANAFDGNTTIEKIILQNGITSLGDSAFANMTALKEIMLPGSVTSYGSDLLTGSNNIESITIASNFNKQLRYLFGNNIANVPASLIKIKYATGCTDVNSTMWANEKLKNEGEPIVLELADDWTSVPAYAFQNCSGIKSLIIPEGVQYINDYAFERCQKLEKVVLPNSLIQINSYVFRNCNLLSDINLEECTSLTQISYQAFYDCDAITELTLPENLKRLSGYAFCEMDGLEKVNFNNKITNIEYDCFESCRKIKTIELPSSLNYVSDSAFNNCVSLILVIIPKGINQFNGYVFQNCYSATVLCEDESKPSNWSSDWANNGPTVVWGYKEIKTVDGYKCVITAENTAIIIGAEDLTKKTYEFPDKVGAYDVVDINLPAIFRDNQVVEEVYIPDYLTAIPGYSFYNCTSLKKVVFSDNTSISSIGRYAFNQCSSLKAITIPDGISTLNSYTFANCTNLRVVVFPNSVTYIYDGVFQNDNSIRTVFYSGTMDDKNNISREWGSDNLFNTTWEYESDVKDVTFVETENYSYLLTDTNKVLNFTFVNKEFEEFSFDDIEGIEMVEISDSMFSGCTNLKSITIPATVTRIGNNAFYNCTSLTAVEFEDNSQLVSIDYRAFYNCNNLKTINLPDTLETIGYSAFENCNVLSNVVLPDALTTIGYNAFRYCNKLGSLFIPNCVTSIGNNAFWHDERNTTIYCQAESRPDGWASNWSNSNYGNDVIWNIKAFGSTEDFDYIVNNNDEAIITKMASSKLSSYEFDDEVDGYTIVELGANLFNNNDKLTTITLPSNLKKIGNYAFYDCDKITEIVLPDTVEEIGSYAFQTCDKLTTITGAKNLKEIKSYAFADNNRLNTFTGPEAVEYIRSGAFQWVNSMQNFFTIEYVKDLESQAFYASNAIKGTVAFKCIEHIGYFALGTSQNRLAKVILPDTLTTIDNYAFCDNNTLRYVYIPSSVTSIGQYAFQNNSSNIKIECEVSEEPEDWDGNWNTNSNDVSWSVAKPIIADEMVYRVKDNGNAKLIGWINNQAKVVKINTVDDYVIDEIDSYVFNNLRNLRKVFIPNTVTTINSYAFYDFNFNPNLDLIIETDSKPVGWSDSWYSNGNYNPWFSSSMDIEFIEITLTSSDQTITYDGNWHNCTSEVTLTSGELAEGDAFSWNNYNSTHDIGTYEALFDCYIYHAEWDEVNQMYMNIDVTKNYIINKVYGTFTINPA